MKKYPRIYTKDHKDVEKLLTNDSDIIFIEEKIDGANFRFMIKDNIIIFGSRTKEFELDVIPKAFKRCVDYIKECIKQHGNNTTTNEGLIFYGECCIMHSIHYDFDKMPLFGVHPI